MLDKDGPDEPEDVSLIGRDDFLGKAEAMAAKYRRYHLCAHTNVRFGSIPAGQDIPVRRSHPMQMAGQVECKQVVKWDANAWSSQMQFPTLPIPSACARIRL